MSPRCLFGQQFSHFHFRFPPLFALKTASAGEKGRIRGAGLGLPACRLSCFRQSGGGQFRVRCCESQFSFFGDAARK